MEIIDNKTLDKKIFVEQIKLLYGALLNIIAMTVIASTILVYVFWDVVSHNSLIIWISAVIIISIARIVNYIFYLRYFNLEKIKRYYWSFMIGTCSGSLLWGIGGIILFPEQNLQFQLIIIFVLIGFTGGAATSVAVYLPAFFLALPLAMLPVLTNLFLINDPLHQTLGYMSIIVTLFVLHFGIKNSRTHRQSLKLNIENSEMALQLRAKKEDSDHANNAKSKFMAAASHDLRQPLHALTLFTSALDEMVETPKVRRVVDQINSSVDALQNLFNALLDISRLDSGTMKVEKTGFHLKPLFEKLANDFDEQAQEKGLQILWPMCDYAVYSDQNLLEQILRNYISNAIRYTDKGDIRITCDSNKGEITINVIDSGLGISSEDQQVIFEEFHQVSNPERDRSKGLGLGLAIVQRTAKLLGHAIAVKSATGEGSTFSISIEQVAISKSENENSQIADDDVSHDGDLLILVVDDEVSVREGMQSLLQVWDCDVLTAEDEEEALRLLKQQGRAPDGIISDYRLRENKTGIEVIHAVQAEYDLDIPALIVTGDIATDKLRDVSSSGFQVLHKPVAPLKLRTFLRNIRLRKKAAVN